MPKKFFDIVQFTSENKTNMCLPLLGRIIIADSKNIIIRMETFQLDVCPPMCNCNLIAPCDKQHITMYSFKKNFWLFLMHLYKRSLRVNIILLIFFLSERLDMISANDNLLSFPKQSSIPINIQRARMRDQLHILNETTNLQVGIIMMTWQTNIKKLNKKETMEIETSQVR